MLTPADVFVGDNEKASRVLNEGVILKVLLVPAVNPAALAIKVYPVPTLLKARPENAAMPPDALTVVVPDRELPPGLLPIEIVMAEDDVATRLS